MKKIFFTSLSALLILCSMSANAQNIRQFKNGDRIVFEGNSITHGGHYHSYIWLYYMTHFPDRKIQIFNCGVGGDVAGGMYKRLDSDVFAKKPSVIFLTFGMNDAGYYEYLKPGAADSATRNVLKSYNDYKKIEKRFQQYPQAEKVIMSSSPFDETAKLKSQNFPGKNAAMLRIDSFQQASAEQNHWGFVDLNRSMTAINVREQQRDSTFTLEGAGRIHPDEDGHLVMAYFILQKQGLAGNDVANIHINAADGKVNKSVNCTISQVKASSNSVRFNYLAKSLPFPVDTVVRGWEVVKPASAALSVIPFMKEFDNEELAVNNLSQGKYVLKIDGQKIAEISSDSLAKGINLAEYKNTPQYQQASEIMQLNEERLTIERKLRDYLWIEYMLLEDKGMAFRYDVATLDTVSEAAKTNPFVKGNFNAFTAGFYKTVRDNWNDQMKQIVDKIYTINKPVTHEIELEELH